MKHHTEEWTDEDWDEFEAWQRKEMGLEKDEDWEAYLAWANKDDGECIPSHCSSCGEELKQSTVFVGERVLYCEEHGVMWEDVEEALRRVR